MGDVLFFSLFTSAIFIVGAAVQYFWMSSHIRDAARRGDLYRLDGHYYLIVEKSADYPADNWQAWLDTQAAIR